MQTSLNGECSCLEVTIVEAEFYNKSEEIASHYTVTLVHGLTRFQTAVFPVRNSKISFQRTRSLVLEYEVNSQKKSSEPILRIVLAPTGSEPKFQALIDQRTLTPWINEESNSRLQSSKRSFYLSYPLICKGRTIVGEVRLLFRFLLIGEEKDVAKSSRLSSRISRCSPSKERRKVFSSPQENWFQPCVSGKITVKVVELEQEIQIEKYENFKNQRKMHQNFEIHQPSQFQQPLKEQTSEKEPQEWKLGEESHRVIDQQISHFGKYLESQVEKNLQDDSLYAKNEIEEEVPQDFKHLFQKISQINKKYAPLERIPSQEELSQEGSILQKQKEDESFYSLNSELSVEGGEGVNPLYRAEQFLKELNLYKFGRSLASHPESDSQTF